MTAGMSAAAPTEECEDTAEMQWLSGTKLYRAKYKKREMPRFGHPSCSN